MVQPIDDEQDAQNAQADPSDDDERVGEAVEAYLAVAEGGRAPDIDEFAGRYAELKDDVKAALEGLELVHGLLGLGSAAGSSGGRGLGLERRIESGRRIAGYRVVRELGRGGMGTVYEAVHVGLDRPVALKVLGTHAAPDSSARRRFLNEARTAAGLHHTHIVPVFDVGQVGGLCYYAMQRIEGSGLDRVLRHLRHTRAQLAVQGGGEITAGPAPKEGAAAVGGSASSSRISRLWVRVSSGWPWRQPRYIEVGQGVGRPLPDGSRATGRPGAASAIHTNELGDSTASWGTGGRRPSNPGRETLGNGASQTAPPNSLRAMSSAEPRSRHHDDEPPPFDPPHGMAYFRWTASVGFQAADALAHAHHQGVIHRDVKPSNLLIDGRGTIWVTDFGLARRLADPGLTHHDSLLGTPRYMSPEQARTGAIDGRTDVYSLGATLYELLTLRPPFDGKSASELIEQIGQREPLLPRSIDPRIPRDLETIVLKALAKRPADRYATAADLAADLARFLNREPVKARRIGPAGRLWRVARRHPGITAVTATAAATILAIATFAHMRVVAALERVTRAQHDTEQALKNEEHANRKRSDALLKQLRSQATLLRFTNLPDRRKRGLETIQKAVEYSPDAQLRSELRDEAVELLVLRSVDKSPSELATGHVQGVALSSESNRLAVLSEDGEQLFLWDLDHRRKIATLPLRLAPNGQDDLTASPSMLDGSAPDSAVIERAESSSATTSTAGGSAGSPRSGNTSNTANSRRMPAPGQRLALAGQAFAVVFPDQHGFRLIDPISGHTLRTVIRPNSSVVGIMADPRGERLITIESSIDESFLLSQLEAAPFPESIPRGFHVNLWSVDQLDSPIARLSWSRSGPQLRPPLAAISPDGKIVAVAAFGGTKVRLFSGVDGQWLRADDRPPQQRRRDIATRAEQRASPLSTESSFHQRRREIETQIELRALAIGPNSLLATAGRSMGGTEGVTVRLWDLDNDKALANLPPSAQTLIWQMRFAPQGKLLALIGSGPPELWDPVALNLVAALRVPEKAFEPIVDLAFGSHGRTIAAVGRTSSTSVWTVVDSAARTQLSGFDNEKRLSSLAFNREGILAGGTSDGGIWFWHPGRCPDTDAIRPETAAPRRSGTGRDSQGRRGPDRGPNPAVVDFDAEGRLIAVDAFGLRIWPESITSDLGPLAIEVPYPAARVGQGFAWFGLPTAAVTKTPDGRVMAVARPSAIFVWHAETPERLIPIVPPGQYSAQSRPVPTDGTPSLPMGGTDTPPMRLRAIQIAPDGQRIYLLDLAGQPHVWSIELNAETNEAHARPLDRPLPVTEGGFIAMAIRPDGKMLAVAERNGTILLLETTNLTVVGRIRPPGDQVASFLLALAFSPDGHDLAVGAREEGTISIWSVDQPSRPRIRLNLPGHRGLFTLAFDPQGRRLASQGSDPLVEVWDLELIQRELSQWGLAN